MKTLDLSYLVHVVEVFLARWFGTTIPRVAAGLLGVSIAALVLVGLRRRRIHAVTAFLWLMPAALLISGAVHPAVFAWILSSSYLTRIRVVMGILSFVVLLITVESIRRTKMQERYALLWIGTGLIILLVAADPVALHFFSDFFGIEYLACVVAVVFTFLILVAFHFSIAMSAFQHRQSTLTQREAILEARVAEIERVLRSMDGAGKSKPEREVETAKHGVER